ncbi:MAG: hypothetical protein DRI23_06760 [Candidatus Cloacimonadota bacterium]|nr:MAG: hypothetical protein DRI23_06760 [Candidatus Cloacimonadota bacterium]
MKKIVLIFTFICFSSFLFPTIWHINLDGTGNFTTIQEGINASTDYDTVLVYPGTYYENINYNGKNITVASLEIITGDPQYISQTVIDGQRITSCVSIVSEEIDTCLRGLTITNGQGEIDYPRLGGGISLLGDFPELIECEIINCIFINNFSENSSAGININDAIVFLSGCSIRQNYACRFGGGIGIGGHSQVTFDPVNRCSIYDNYAGSGIEMFVETIHYDYQEVILDTFTVAEPDRYFAQVFPGNPDFIYNFDILNYIVEPVEQDMFVSPWGDDNNSGLNPNEPLRTINLAVRNIASNPDNPHTVFLAEGTYNHSDNQQTFSIGCKADVNIIGADINTTIVDGEYDNHPFFITGSEYHNSSIKNITFQNVQYYSSLIMLYFSDFIRLENINVLNAIVDRGSGINSATSGGNISLENVTINNISVQDGGCAGGQFNSTTSLNVNNCNFSNNNSVGHSGLSAGLYTTCNGDITIENCKFFNNSTTSTTFLGYASALLCTDYNDVIGDTYINNCLFYSNNVNNGKSTIYAESNDNSTVYFYNNTLVDNESPYGIEFEGNIDFSNNILQNEGNYEITLFDKTSMGIVTEIDISNSNIEDGEDAVFNENGANIVNWLVGNIDEDPLFLISGDDPYQLSEFSPCIDVGTPDTTGLFIPPWDLLNNHRVWDGIGNGTEIIDMGCYEFGAPHYVDIGENEISVLSIDNTNLTNYPNPFNPNTTIKLELAETGKIELAIYNIKGQKVKSLLDCITVPGTYECIWAGKDGNGKPVSSGQYIVKLKQNGKETATKIMLLK